MAENENPFPNILSEDLASKFPMPRLKTPDGATDATTSAMILAEIQEEELRHAKIMASLLPKLKDSLKREKEYMGKSVRDLSSALQLRGD